MSSASSLTFAKLECPICLLIPREEIYQCANGHSICHICMTKVTVCPTCRVAVSGLQAVKIRNHYAETFLDTMKFSCGWKEQGCEVSIPRDQLPAHERVCKYGTINICKHFKRSTRCQFEFSTMDLYNSEKVKQVLDHMNYAHKFIVAKQMSSDQSKNLSMDKTQLNLVAKPNQVTKNGSLIFQEVINGNQQTNSSEVFAMLFNLEQDHQNQKLFSLAFAKLTSEMAEISSNIKVKVSIKGQKTTEDVETWGEDCVPDINWTMRPMSVHNFMKYLETQLENRPPFPFTVPISHLLKHYVDSDGLFSIQYSFHKQ